MKSSIRPHGTVSKIKQRAGKTAQWLAALCGSTNVNSYNGPDSVPSTHVVTDNSAQDQFWRI